MVYNGGVLLHLGILVFPLSSSLGRGLKTSLFVLFGLRSVSDIHCYDKRKRSDQTTDLLRSLKSWRAVFLSSVWENWAMAGGTFNR